MTKDFYVLSANRRLAIGGGIGGKSVILVPERERRRAGQGTGINASESMTPEMMTAIFWLRCALFTERAMT